MTASAGRVLGRPRAEYAVLAAGIRAVHAYERLGGRRRMVPLRTPEHRDALGGPAAAAPEFARGPLTATPAP